VLLELTEAKEHARGDIDFVDLKLAYYAAEKPPDGIIYVFTDRTIRETTLADYTYIAVFAMIIALVCVFFISVYLAGKAIAPIRVSMEKQEKFIADASHELRTPLAVIRSNVEMIMDAPELTVEENMKWLEYILKESKRMAKMTEELLFLSKADMQSKGGVKDLAVKKEKIDLSILVSGIFDSFVKLFEENRLFDNTRKIEQNIFISANENQIRQLVTILLDNAIKYTKEGGISVSLEKDEGFACIKVSDTGQGIAPEMRDKIFERFFRTDKARSRAAGGAGLGLSIAKTIAEEHGGQISVESELGKGSVFSIKLPADVST
jgi:signal transduction histidine kinase